MKFKTYKKLRKFFGRFAIRYEDRILEKADDIKFYRSILEDEENENAEKKYLEIRERAQHDGQFAVVSFDMKGSRNGYDYEMLHKLFDEYAEEIRNLEEKWGIEILHEPAEHSLPYKNGYFELGDLFSFPVLFDPELEILFFTYVFQKVKKRLNIDYEFHFIMLRYETDYYFEGGLKYYLMDAVKDSEKLSKEKDELI